MTGQTETTDYRVLARKYRPSNFAELIGQEALVRTLTNAMASGRLAHAFILTGVRGIGKTTTARIIARALNCIGPDGAGGPTAEPCGVCENCVSIAEDRHVDVLEMDAASRTGVDDIRDLIDGVLYRPVSARYKVYIIDEVHMLSKNAFNALLKTLEEPPEHVKFIFATTEIRKVPVTVLSRCQRFDLRRVEAETLGAHLADIAARENANVSAEALALMARASDGSVRDGLSLLDQAIAHTGADTGDGEIGEDQVRDMLGLVDRMLNFDLFDALMKGDIGGALSIADDMFNAGADPVVVLQDLLELSHALTRLKIVPDAGAGDAVSDVERRRGREMADALAMPALARAWQMLLKGVGEARVAPSARQAMEMILVRLAYVAELPAPADLVRTLRADEARAEPAAAPNAAPQPNPPPATPPPAELEPKPPPADVSPSLPQSFEDVVKLFAEKREMTLYAHLMNDAHLVSYAPGRIELATGPDAPPDLVMRTARLLGEWTGESWTVDAAPAGQGAPSLRAQMDSAEAAEREDAINHPDVQAALLAFPGARVADVREAARAAAFETDTIDPDGDPDAEPANGDHA